MAGPIQNPAAAGPRARQRLSVNRVSIAAWPRAAAIRVIGLIVLPIAAILAAVPLVPRTRSSHDFSASTVANFGFKSGTKIITLLVSLSIPKFAQSSPQGLANFGIGTLALGMVIGLNILLLGRLGIG